jgi:hypothetical protein
MIQEFSISGWFKLTRGVIRVAPATGYHFSSYLNAEDVAKPGDRTLSFFVIGNIFHFSTYNLSPANNNLY